ncbi:hypothetical protein OD91_2125 [Lutibacter sp. Hel_I_33_5]|uniref:hypothetical protein n=1 Tax=Lutibacter sp. Hel_I_33_5 TaxID=1566289 RepID=UPI0011ADB353|nr:hypothetical protein [Lutibacter sp. Hel_I_33_5]TVZ56825.1 hypothetical protein OD91_2125 [Lutibacter sp. Hel_I_33_5]
MKTNIGIVLIITLLLSSCIGSVDLDTNLQSYLDDNSLLEKGEVIACAASKKNDDTTAFIFYYPIVGAEEILYFETESAGVDPNDFSNYHFKALPKEPVFNGYLERFVKGEVKEVYCLVTYIVNNTLHKSNPIRLKNQSKPTEWNEKVSIDFTQSTMPVFSWKDGIYDDTEIYFEVLADKENNLLSGTYTYDKKFQYYNLNNVVLNVTRNIPPKLESSEEYSFTLMGVSKDNWVNLVVQKTFIIP